jgi:hypothetical protein
MSAATTEAADLIKNSYSIVVKGAQDYNEEFIEFTQANTHAAFDFVQKLSDVKSPSAFVELSTEHARKQLGFARGRGGAGSWGRLGRDWR